MSNTLKNYCSSGKSDSHYTMYFYNYDLSEVINFFSDKLEKLNKSIKDSYKRKLANNILYEVKCNLEANQFNNPFNYFILANESECNIIPFSLDDLQLASEWNIPTSMFEYDCKFKINHLIKLFSTNRNIIDNCSSGNKENIAHLSNRINFITLNNIGSVSINNQLNTNKVRNFMRSELIK